MTSSIASNISNAFIDFSQMTCSVVAVITDQYRDGEQIVGYGFNSNGRYGAAAVFIPWNAFFSCASFALQGLATRRRYASGKQQIFIF